MTPPAAFYCVSSELYFPGAVGLVNSLRLQGHSEPMLPARLRALRAPSAELIAPDATIVPAPRELPPYLLKTLAPLAHPAEVSVLIDIDMIVTRPLDELIERAAEGAAVAFRDDR